MKKFQIPSAMKGIIGLIVMFAVIFGGGLAIARYENNARTNPEGTESNATPVEQCYTATHNLAFSTGNPTRDAVLAQVIKDNKGSQELDAFIADYQKNKVLDMTHALWKAAEDKVGDKVELKQYLSMTPSGAISVVDNAKAGYYLEGRLPYPDSLKTDFMYVKTALVDSDTNMTTNETREYIAAVNSNDSRHVLVFAVEKSENDKREGITITQVLPVC